MIKKSYENFQDDFFKLKEKFPNISYGKIARELDVSDAYAYNLPNRRRASFIPMVMIERIAKIFHVKPEYFYEYRLQVMLKKIDKDRKFLDTCEYHIKKRSAKEAPAVKKESLETENEDNQKQSAQN